MDDNRAFRQYYFDEEMNIRQETNVVSRTMSQEEVEEYEVMVEDANQMDIFDFLLQN